MHRPTSALSNGTVFTALCSTSYGRSKEIQMHIAEWTYSSTHYYPRQQMEVSGQLMSPGPILVCSTDQKTAIFIHWAKSSAIIGWMKEMFVDRYFLTIRFPLSTQSAYCRFVHTNTRSYIFGFRQCRLAICPHAARNARGSSALKYNGIISKREPFAFLILSNRWISGLSTITTVESIFKTCHVTIKTAIYF
jgi:hypothetical protein